MSLSEVLPTTAIDCVLEFSPRSATGNCKRRTWPWSLHGGYSGTQTSDLPVEKHRLYKCTIMPHGRWPLWRPLGSLSHTYVVREIF